MLWTITAILLVVDIAWVSLANWSVSWPSVVLLLLALSALHVPLLIRRYRRNQRIRTVLEAGTLLLVFMACAGTFSYLVVSTNTPLVDASLAEWDRALGFDWLGTQQWIHAHRAIESLLGMAYQSGTPQLVLIVLFLGLSARFERLHEFMQLFFVATITCVLLSAVWPAAGAWKYYSPSIPVDLGSLSHFELLRSGRMRHIALGEMQGLISIPSLHAAMAVLLAYATRRTIVFAPLLILNGLVLISTPVSGSHYLVDVLAGVMLAGALILLSQLRNSRVSMAGRTAVREPGAGVYS